MGISNEIEIIKTILIILSGLWVCYNFMLKREQYPKIEFTLDLILIDQTNDNLVIEFVALFENKGIARHYIDLETFILKIRYLNDADMLSLNNHTKLPFKDKKGVTSIDFFSLNFPHSVKPDFGADKEILWMPKEWKYIYVDGGTKQRISLPLAIPKVAKHLLLKSEFNYTERKSGRHSAQRIFSVDNLKNNVPT